LLIQIRLLIGRPDPRIYRSPPMPGRLGRRIIHQNQPTCSLRRNGQPPTVKPAIRSHPRNTVELRP